MQARYAIWDQPLVYVLLTGGVLLLAGFVAVDAVRAITCALLTIGTASKSKLEGVLPTGSRASAR